MTPRYSIPKKHRRRGFASFTAVALLGMSAVALTMLAAHTIRQSKRASNLASDAQLRQLLAAGEIYLASLTPDQLNKLTPIQAQLPEPLATQYAVLTITPVVASAGAPAAYDIQAQINGRTASQTLAYDSQARNWQLQQIVLP